MFACAYIRLRERNLDANVNVPSTELQVITDIRLNDAE